MAKADIEKSRISKMRELHSKIESGLKMTLEAALELGGMLVETKAELSHGEFLPWIAANMNFAERTARYYMAMYRKRGIFKTANVADLAGAYCLLEPAPEDRRVEFEKRILQVGKLKDEDKYITNRINALATIAEEIRDTKKSSLYGGCYRQCEKMLCELLAPPVDYTTDGLKVKVKQELRVVLGEWVIFGIKEFVPTIEWAERWADRSNRIPPFETRQKAIDVLMIPSHDFFEVLISYPGFECGPDNEGGYGSTCRVWRGFLYENMRETVDLREMAEWGVIWKRELKEIDKHFD